MIDQLDKYELRIHNDILLIYNFIVKMSPFRPTDLIFKEIWETFKNKGYYLPLR